MTEPASTPPRPPITSVDDLKNHLWEACFVEVSTIPLYLYGLYSIKSQIEGSDAGYSGDINKSSSASAITEMSPFRTIRSVVVEEMLHLTHARNVLYSIGGSITFYDPCFVPRYGLIDEPNCSPPDSAPPGAPLQPQLRGQQYMLHRVPRLAFNLVRCTQAQVEDTYLPLEQPEEPGARPQSDWYNSIGQFYAAIEAGFDHLSGDPQIAPTLFQDSQAAFQLHSVASYWNQEGGGVPIGVTDLDSVKTAIREIVDQGEGAHGDETQITFGDPARYVGNYEYSHYEKFQRVCATIKNIKADARAAAAAADSTLTATELDALADQAWEDRLWPLQTNPRLAHYDGPLRQLAEFCNAVYCYTLILIDANYTVPLPAAVLATERPLPPEVYSDANMKAKWGLTQALLTTMSGILFPVVDLLVRQPAAPGSDDHAGPTFEFYAGFQACATKDDRKQHLLDLCDALVPTYPALGGTDSVRERIVNLPAA